MDFSNILNMLSNLNNENKNKNSQNNISSLEKQKNTVDYPYGEFPYNYTVEGQKRLKEKLNKSTNFNNDFNNKENFKGQVNQNSSINSSQSFNLNNILPLLSTMLGNKKNNNILNTILPLLGGNSNIDLSEIIKRESVSKVQDKPSENILPDSDFDSIDNYKRV